MLNRLLHRREDDALKLTTLRDHVEAQGSRISEELSARSSGVLSEHVPDYDGGVPDQDILSEKFPAPTAQESLSDWSDFSDVINSYNEGKEAPDQISRRDLVEKTETDPENCVYISIDDVGVSHQKDQRKDGGSKRGKRVENTVIHVESSGKKYVLTAVGMEKAFQILLAFLIANDLLEGHHLFFFSDGAQNIRKSLETWFSFRSYTLILDWFHLQKHMYEILSMAIKGNKATKEEIQYAVDRKLWAGNVDEAIAYLKSLDQAKIKSQAWFDESLAYLDRKRDYIACYALRSLLNYRNSSNPAEKSNDILVADRQKHNGMSWSYGGSGSLAVITALQQNNELEQWISRQTIRYSFDAITQSDNKAA